MAYLLRLIAAFIFLFAGANVWAQICPLEGADLLLDPDERTGAQFLCIAGCKFELSSNGDGLYLSLEEPCDSGEGGDDGSGSGNPGDGDPDNGDPDIDTFDPLLCKDEDDYLHHCIDSFGDYWIYNDYIDACSKPNDELEEFEICSERREDGVYFKYKDDRGDIFGSYDYFHAQYMMCGHQFVSDSEGWEIDNDQLLYCANRYLSGYESNLYDNSLSEFMNNNNNGSGTDSDDDDDDDDEGDDSKTIDLRTKLGISENGDGSLSSTIPDLLGHARPSKSGEHGVCLDDITVEIGGHEIVLEISRVCEWLEILGTIFVFISLFIAIQIIVRD